jgi:hypothetical protein
MSSTVSGWTLGYTAVGGVLLWSGIKGTSISGSVRDILAGKAPSGNSEPIGTPELSLGQSSSVGTTAPATATSASGTKSQTQWADDFLTAIGAPQTAANVQSIITWINEEGDFAVSGHNNPLNTTQVTSGSTGAFNSTGVQNYGSEAEGIAATVETLLAGGYGDILMLLRSGKGLSSGAATGLSRWSNGAYSSV